MHGRRTETSKEIKEIEAETEDGRLSISRIQVRSFGQLHHALLYGRAGALAGEPGPREPPATLLGLRPRRSTIGAHQVRGEERVVLRRPPREASRSWSARRRRHGEPARRGLHLPLTLP
jgi:hypothetical protein